MSERSYDLIARLGRGGMGVVDLARDADGNKVALKRLTLHGSASEIARSRQRLLREAAVLRKLHHPNVVGLLDVVDEGDEIVLVMPYMSGGSLAERVAQHGPAPAEEVERQARRLLGALASAHAAGIVHRDLKPANILFDERGEPCLADFGVALSHDQTHGLTVAGMVVGTPGFMAPEQARGEAVSPATDVFSLGATLLFAATGDGPYGQGDPGLLMVRAAGGKVERVPKSLPGSLRKLLEAMLDPRPERRPVAAAIAGDGRDRAAARALAMAPDWNRRSWAVAAGCAAALALAAIGIALALGGGGSDGSTDETPRTPDAGADAGAGAEAPEVGDEAPAPDDGCVDLPFQPCGEDAPAANTDGTECTEDHDDYDGRWQNGCEAVPDDQDGRTLENGAPINANIVPGDDVDTYPLELDDTLQLTCDGAVEIMLEAPPGIALSMDVVDSDGGVVESAVSTTETPAIIVLDEQECGSDDRLQLEVVIQAVGGDRVADDYILTRTGEF